MIVTRVPEQEVKSFYEKYNDDMTGVRYHSEYPMRAYAHRARNEHLLQLLVPGQRMIEVGAGDGAFAVMAAKKGLTVVATDISEPNIERMKRYVEEQGVSDKVTCVLASADQLPYEDDSFDIVVASHVLEHVPDFDKALAEVRRVTRDKALIALPTCMSPCAWVLLGAGGGWWYFGKRSIPSMIFGFSRVVFAFCTGKDWVDEGGYGGKKGIPHLWRFPGAMRRHLREGGFDVVLFGADSFPFPWVNGLVPASRFLDRFRSAPIMRNFGYGSHALLQKKMRGQAS
ncbi:MAG: class I SAM-dependent methyltransferase [Patescibacteria group bacterium]